MPTALNYLDEVRTQELITEIKTRLATKVTQYTSMPEVTAGMLNQIALYVGASDQNYTQGDFYKANTTTNTWDKITYTKAEIDEMIVASGNFIPVAELPTEDISTTAIYLVPRTEDITGYSDGTENADVYVATGTATTPSYDKYEYDDTFEIYVFAEEVTGADAETIKGYIDGGTYTSETVTAERRDAHNVKDEYINLDGTTTGWELIGSTDIDLTDYVKKTDLVPISSAELAAMWNN